MKLLLSICFIFFAVVTLTGCENSGVSANAAPDSSIPVQQTHFCQIIKNVPIEKNKSKSKPSASQIRSKKGKSRIESGKSFPRCLKSFMLSLAHRDHLPIGGRGFSQSEMNHR